MRNVAGMPLYGHLMCVSLGEETLYGNSPIIEASIRHFGVQRYTLEITNVSLQFLLLARNPDR